MAKEVRKTVCPHDCPDTCSILAGRGRLTDLGECSTLHESLVNVAAGSPEAPAPDGA